MKIVDFLRPEMVVPDLAGRDKNAVLQELAAHLASHMDGATSERVFQVLLDREKLASTAIGEGVAIPHGKLAALPKLSACLGRSLPGVDFESMDGRPTHVFFVLVAPEHSTGEHLKALARISRLFKDPEFRTRLMEAKDAVDLFRVVSDEDAKY